MTSNTVEPLLDPSNQKFTMFPIKYRNIWNLYKKQMACFWKAEEIDFSNDYSDFLTLDENEKLFVEMVLAFFASSDGIVNFNLSERFTREIKITEVVVTYQFQIMMENIHSEVYSLMLDNIVRDRDRKTFLFDAIKTVPSVKLMSDWAFKWIESTASFAHRVVVFAIIEGVFFSGAFAAIFWLKKYKNNNMNVNGSNSGHGKPFMNGLITSNKFIARDEGLHCEFACEVYKLLINKLSISEMNSIFEEAVNISKKFIEDALPVKLIGINNESMCNYIEYVSDRLLSMLDYPKRYGTNNPFKFMETMGLDGKSNFFEVRSTEYQDAHIMNSDNGSKIIISDDF